MIKRAITMACFYIFTVLDGLLNRLFKITLLIFLLRFFSTAWRDALSSS